MALLGAPYIYDISSLRVKGKWGGQVARMDQRFIAERKNRQKYRATEDPIGRHVQVGSNKTAVKSNQHLERVE